MCNLLVGSCGKSELVVLNIETMPWASYIFAGLDYTIMNTQCATKDLTLECL